MQPLPAQSVLHHQFPPTPLAGDTGGLGAARRPEVAGLLHSDTEK